jgi:hypothetical protein
LSDVKTQATSAVPSTADEHISARRTPLELIAASRAIANSVVESAYLPWVIVGIGLVLRVGRYLHERSLWLDESQLALNVMSRSYSHLVGALDFDQGAPVGFLMLEKLAISIFGDGERAFRLFPLLAGLASVFVFWRVASRFLDRASALLALAFFAVLVPLTFYSAETKPYSFDVLMALVVLWLFDLAVSSDRRGAWVAFAVVGVAAPWLSYGSVFVLAGTAAAMLLAGAVAQDWRKVLLTSAAIAVWIASFGLEYLSATRHASRLLSLGQNQSFAGGSGDNSVLKHVYAIFSDSGAIPRTLVGLTALLVGVGAIALGRASWPRLAALALTTLAAVLTAAAGRYPLEGRWELFLLPLAVLLLARGGVYLVRSTGMPVKVLVASLVALLLVIPSWTALHELKHLPAAQASTPATLQPTKQLLSRLTDLWRTGDTLYVSVKSQYAFRYYLTCHDCNPRRSEEVQLWPFRTTAGPIQTSPAIVALRPSLVVGSSPDYLDDYIKDFERLRGRSRVWLLFTHTPPVDEGTLEWWLNREGRQIRAIRAGAAVLLLYDFRS